MVVEHAVAQKQPADDQKRHQRKVDRVETEAAFDILGNGNDHLAEGEDDVEHDTLGEMLKVDGHQRVNTRGERRGNEADQQRDP